MSWTSRRTIVALVCLAVFFGLSVAILWRAHRPPTLDARYVGTLRITPDHARPGQTVGVSFVTGSGTAWGLVYTRWRKGGWRESYTLVDDHWQRLVAPGDGQRLELTGILLERPPARSAASGTIDPVAIQLPMDVTAGTYRVCDVDAKACALLTIER